MRITSVAGSAVLLLGMLATSASVRAQQVLTGDTRLACEAMLCLAAGQRPDECDNSIRRYFSISHRKIRDTIRARRNFLEMCPATQQTPEMQSFADALASGSGRCDAKSLNVVMLNLRGGDNGQVYISDKLPEYCSVYLTHSYTNFGDTTPKYVGDPDRGGYWVPASEYDQALLEYQERIAAEDAANQYDTGGGGGS